MNSEEFNDRIQELEERIAPLQQELRHFKHLRKVQKATECSVAVRQKQAADRHRQIEMVPMASLDLRYKRNGGLIKSVAEQFSVSTRTVSRIYAEM